MLGTPEQLRDYFNLDISILSRNYINSPLIKKGGKYIYYPTKEDLEYLFITKNMTDTELSLFLSVGKNLIEVLRKRYNIVKSKNLKKLIRERLSLEKYGVTSPNKLIEKKDKCKKTCLKKYGHICSGQNIQIKKEAQETILKKYGTKHPMQSEIVKKKVQKTNLEKYGVLSSNSLQWKKDKIKKKILEKYNVSNVSKSDKIKQKKIFTCRKHYGVDYPQQAKEIKQKMLNQIAMIVEKRYKTRKSHNSFNKSAPEDRIYNQILTKFPDIQRQYKSDRYPYVCDFYIPSLDVFIEYQGTWIHGDHPFDPNNKEDVELIEKFKLKAKELNFQGKPKRQYLYAIETWTIRDVQKREVAKKNNLNYLEFFNIEEFMEWYNKL